MPMVFFRLLCKNALGEVEGVLAVTTPHGTGLGVRRERLPVSVPEDPRQPVGQLG